MIFKTPKADHFQSLPFVLDFRATKFCNYNCQYCCEDCGPWHPQRYIPQETIIGMMDKELDNPQFSKIIRLTGGEILTTYKKHRTDYDASPDYIPNILKFCADNNILATIETNISWINDNIIKDKILADLQAYGATRKIDDNHCSDFVVGLSLDEMHENSVENIALLFDALRDSNSEIIFCIGYFQEQNYLLDKLCNALKKKNLKISQNTEHDMVFYANNTLFYFHRLTCWARGRGKRMPGAIPFSKYAFFFNTEQPLVTITLENNGFAYAGDIKARWNPKENMNQIQHKLTRKIRLHEIADNIIHPFKRR